VVDAYTVPFVDGVAYGLLLFVVAAGLMLAFAVGGVLNLAHGVVFALGAYLCATVSDGSWAATGLAVAVGTAAGAGCGGLLAAALAPLRGRGHLAQALLTMGAAFVATDLLRTAFGPYDLATAVPAPLAGSARLVGHAYPAYRLALILAGGLIAAAGWWLLTRTRVGSCVRAAVDDPEMLAAIGVRPASVHGGVMLAAGALAGLAGALGGPILGAGPTTANSVLLISLVVVVLGGMRSVPATLVAALGVGQVQTLGVALAPGLAPFLLFAAMAGALIVRPGRALA
jgi:branched-subunit amino acid ABC-type transport system permease component